MKFRDKADRFNDWWVGVPESGCWLWTGAVNHAGYGAMFLSRPKRETIRAHRLSWELRNGPIPAGLHVLHRCDVPSCVNPDHLWLGTHAENMADGAKKKRFIGARGEASRRAKLTEVQVLKILSDTRYRASRTLAREHGVSESTIQSIRKRRIWKHLGVNNGPSTEI